MTFKTNRIFVLLVGIMINFFSVNMLSMAIQMPGTEFFLIVSPMCLLFALAGLVAIGSYFRMEKEVEFTETSLLIRYSRTKIKEIPYSEIQHLEIAKGYGTQKTCGYKYVYNIFFYDKDGKLIYHPSISFGPYQFEEFMNFLSMNDTNIKRLLELKGDIFNRKPSLKRY